MDELKCLLNGLFMNIPCKSQQRLSCLTLRVCILPLNKIIDFAKQHTAISKSDYDIIQHARTSLLYNNGDPWIKKGGGKFDVTMDAEI